MKSRPAGICSAERQPARPDFDLIILLPDLAQQLHSGKGLQPSWRVSSVNRLKQQEPIGTDDLRVRNPFLFADRQTIILDPMSVAFDPVGGTVRQEPVGRNLGEAVEGMAESFPNTFQAIQSPNRCQDVRGVGPLLTACFEHPTRSQVVQQRLKQDLFPFTVDQAASEFAEHTVVKTGVLKRQTEQILPVDPCANRIGRLSVGEISANCKIQTSASRQGHSAG